MSKDTFKAGQPNVNHITDEALMGFIDIRQERPCESFQSDLLSFFESEQETDSFKCETLPEHSFGTRAASLQAWFLRASSTTKTKWLNCLLQNLKNKSYLEDIVYASNYNLDKLKVYSLSQPSTPFIYDKCLNDHDRSLEKNCLEETFKSDLSWFVTLKPEHQMEIVLGLLELCSGILVDRFFESARKLRDEENRKTTRAQNQNQLMDVTVNSDTTLAIGVEIEDKDDTLLAQRIRKQADLLNEAFCEYQVQLYGTCSKRKSKKRDSRHPPSPSVKSGKGTNRSKSSSTKGKNQSPPISPSLRSRSSQGREKKVKMQGLDQIQMLPVWIVKKIFNYLEQSTLKKIREVNNYWSIIVDDISKERACRKWIDSRIKKIEPDVQECLNMESIYKPPTTGDGPTNLQKRMIKLADRGAVTSKLRASFASKIKTQSLAERVAQEIQLGLEAQASNERAESFPRNVPSGRQILATPSEVLAEPGKQRFKPRKKDCGGSCANVPKKNSDGSERSVETGFCRNMEKEIKELNMEKNNKENLVNENKANEEI